MASQPIDLLSSGIAVVRAATPPIIQPPTIKTLDITPMDTPPDYLLEAADARILKDNGRVDFVFLRICEACELNLQHCQCGPKCELSERLVYNREVGMNQMFMDALSKNIQNATPKTKPAGRALVRETLARRYRAGQIIELRAPKTTKGLGTVTYGGFYTDHEKLIQDIVWLSNETDTPAIYTGLQEINSDEAHQQRVTNELRIVLKGEGASASDIVRYRWLLIDIDAVRPEYVGESSTNEEKAACLPVLAAVMKYFEDLGYVGDSYDSGNSYHFMLPLDLPATAENEELLKRVLESLAASFDTLDATIDQSVYDRPRICKLPGTRARKGKHTKERPHRFSAILDLDDSSIPILEAALLEIAGLKEAPKIKAVIAADNEEIQQSINFLEEFIDWAGIQVCKPQPHAGGYIWVFDGKSYCPWEHRTDPHHEGECHVGVNVEAKLCFACKHSTCQKAGHGWKQFRAEIEKQKGDSFRYGLITPGDAAAMSDVLLDTNAPTEIIEDMYPSVQEQTEANTKVEAVAVAVAVVDASAEIATAVNSDVVDKAPESDEREKLIAFLESPEFSATNLGAALLFELVLGSSYIFATYKGEGRWRQFSNVWYETGNAALKNQTLAFIRKLRKVQSLPISPAALETVAKLQQKLTGNNFVNGFHAFLQGRLEKDISAFDTKPHLFNFSNGTLDLKTLEFRSFSPTDMLTQMAGAAYKREAQCPTFHRFLRTSFPDEGVRRFIIRYFGYCMTPSNEDKMAGVFFGDNDCGKSVLVEVLRAVFGNYAVSASWGTFAVDKYNNVKIGNDIARLHTARVVFCDEGGDDLDLNVLLFKALTGNTFMHSRFMYKEIFEFKASFKLCLLANSRPRVIGGDNAFWSRMNSIEMRHNFPVGHPGRIANLSTLLKEERDGIAALIVEGYKEYCRDGLNPPKEIQLATKAYREHSDTQSDFFEQDCEVGEGLGCRVDDAQARYSLHAPQNGWPAKDAASFRTMCMKKGLRVEKQEGVQGKPWYIFGLALRKPVHGGGVAGQLIDIGKGR